MHLIDRGHERLNLILLERGSIDKRRLQPIDLLTRSRGALIRFPRLTGLLLPSVRRCGVSFRSLEREIASRGLDCVDAFSRPRRCRVAGPFYGFQLSKPSRQYIGSGALALKVAIGGHRDGDSDSGQYGKHQSCSIHARRHIALALALDTHQFTYLSAYYQTPAYYQDTHRPLDE
ncbi:MAG: hypothetical protein ACREV5_19090 [Steroidobacter sp.]